MSTKQSILVLIGLLGLQSALPAEPVVVAHRGLLLHAPENTLANFRACLELRLGFEFDVERTQDGQLVCIHDGTVDRTTDGSGRVSELTTAQLKRLDAGSWFHPRFAGERVPTVAEVFRLIAQYRDRDILVAVDLKAADVGEDTVRLAAELDVLPRLLFIGRAIREPKLREQIRRTSSEAHVAAVANTPDEFESALGEANADWVYVRFLPTDGQVDRVHRAGKRVFVAGPTVSGHLPENWRRASRVGVDGILTDHPLDLRVTLRR